MTSNDPSLDERSLDEQSSDDLSLDEQSLDEQSSFDDGAYCLYCIGTLRHGVCTECGIGNEQLIERIMDGLIEITRSFSYKLNAGKYETRDFFCSQKAECRPEDAEATSERLYQFCKQEVIKALKEWKLFVKSGVGMTLQD